MLLGLSSLKPLWSRLRRSRSSESKPQARAGSRTAKPLTLNTIAAAAVSEDSLPFAEPKSPRGAPKGSTNLPFHVARLGNEVENKKGAKGNEVENKKATKGKHNNGGSNDASSGSARTSSLLPPEMSPGKGHRSRKSSRTNTPTSSPPTSPETKNENLASGKQSANTSPHTSPSKHVLRSTLPSSDRTIPPPPPKTQNTSGVQSTTPPGSNTTTPTHSPETQSLTLATKTPVIKDGTTSSLPGNPSGPAEIKDEQGPVLSITPPDDITTPPPLPRIQNTALPMEAVGQTGKDDPAPSQLENPSGDKQARVQSTTPSGTDNITPAPSSETQNSTSPTETLVIRVGSAALPSSKG